MSKGLAQKLTYELETKLQIEFAFERFTSVGGSENRAWYGRIFRGTIGVPKCRGRRFREFLYHELGHALLAEYSPSKSLLKNFTQRQTGILQYYKETDVFAQKDRKVGFVSGYAALNTHEDFCETFAAFASNNFKTTGTISFNGELINLEHDKKLKRKFKAILEIIETCQEIEDEYEEAS